MGMAWVETGRKINCIISDAFFVFAGKMAEEIDVYLGSHFGRPDRTHFFSTLTLRSYGKG